MNYFEAIIKVNPTDERTRRARDIAEGIGYACALLHSEYEWTADDVAELLERVTDEVHDAEIQRAAG